MAVHKKPAKLAVPLALGLSVLAVAAAAAGYTLTADHPSGPAGSHVVEAVNPASTSQAPGPAGQQLAVTACLASGKLARVSVTAGVKCPAKSVPFHWTAQPGLASATGTTGTASQQTTVTVCLASGKLARVSVAAAAQCPAFSAPLHWAAQLGLAAAAGPQLTVTACLTAGKLTQISLAGAKCPANSTLVHWGARPGPAAPSHPQPSASATSTSPSVSPTTHTTSPATQPDPTTAAPTTASPTTASPTTASPSTAQSSTNHGTWAWCSSAPLGEQSVPGGRFDLYNNEWNSSGNPGPQTICGNSESDWQATSTQRAGNTAVLTYPSVQLNYNGANGYPLSKFTSMTSTYTENMHAVSGTDAEAAYDIWLNNLNKEVMIWVDNHGQTPAGSKVATTSFSGATWDLYETSNRGYTAFVREGNASSGTVDLLAALKYLEGRGDLTGSDVLWQVNLGWEICSTAGTAETFTVSNYSVTSSPSS